MCFNNQPYSFIPYSFFGFIFYTFSISMYIMCVVLCLLSALSHRVGASQISIIIIIIIIIMHKMAEDLAS